MKEFKTASYFVYVDSKGKVQLAKCLKTGRFVIRSLAQKEVDNIGNKVEKSSCMALIVCIAANLSAGVYLYTNKPLTVLTVFSIAFALYQMYAVYIENQSQNLNLV